MGEVDVEFSNRKYCELDDCARLRDIVDALSSKRHYVTSLLILRWVNEERQDKDKDKVVVNDEFMNMVRLLSPPLVGLCIQCFF